MSELKFRSQTATTPVLQSNKVKGDFERGGFTVQMGMWHAGSRRAGTHRPHTSCWSKLLHTTSISHNPPQLFRTQGTGDDGNKTLDEREWACETCWLPHVQDEDSIEVGERVEER